MTTPQKLAALVLAMMLGGAAPPAFAAPASAFGRMCRRIVRAQGNAAALFTRAEEASRRRCGRGARATRSMALGGNLWADAPEVPGGFVGSSLASAFRTSRFTVTVRIFDASGQARDLNAFFTPVGSNVGTLYLGVRVGDGLQVLTPGGVQLAFDAKGNIRSARRVSTTVAFAGLGVQHLTLDLSAMTQNENPSGVVCALVDGCPSAE